MTHDPTTSIEPVPEPPASSAGSAPPEGAAGPADAAELERQRDELRERLLRTAAEFDNYRKRVDRERRDLAEAASLDLIRDLLPLIDDLERALGVEATGEEAEAYRRGFEIIHRQLLDALRKRGVTPIEAVGRTFDPRYHEAVVHEPSAGHADGEVIGELRRGYLIGDRLLRPSMVKVAKA
jgi:molecular chaperone GrpE